MARHDVQMPDEITIQSMDLNQLHALSVDCEIQQAVAVPPPAGYTQNGTTYSPDILEDELRKMLVTVRALFDGRQFSIEWRDLLRLQAVILPNLDISTLTTPELALQCAYYFNDLP